MMDPFLTWIGIPPTPITTTPPLEDIWMKILLLLLLLHRRRRPLLLPSLTILLPLEELWMITLPSDLEAFMDYLTTPLPLLLPPLPLLPLLLLYYLKSPSAKS